MDKDLRARLLWVTAGVAIILSFFVWPTLYRYESTKLQEYSGWVDKLIRINRITGNAAVLTEHGWERLRPISPPTVTPSDDVPASYPDSQASQTQLPKLRQLYDNRTGVDGRSIDDIRDSELVESYIRSNHPEVVIPDGEEERLEFLRGYVEEIEVGADSILKAR